MKKKTNPIMNKISDRLPTAYLLVAIPALALSAPLYLSHRPWAAALVWAGLGAAGLVLSRMQRKRNIRPVSRPVVALLGWIGAGLSLFQVSVFLITYSM